MKKILTLLLSLAFLTFPMKFGLAVMHPLHQDLVISVAAPVTLPSSGDSAQWRENSSSIAYVPRSYIAHKDSPIIVEPLSTAVILVFFAFVVAPPGAFVFKWLPLLRRLRSPPVAA
jgi:hypothetical protein